MIEYTVIEYVTYTEVLDSVWPGLSDAQKRNLVNAVADAVKRLQKVTLQDQSYFGRHHFWKTTSRWVSGSRIRLLFGHHQLSSRHRRQT